MLKFKELFMESKIAANNYLVVIDKSEYYSTINLSTGKNSGWAKDEDESINKKFSVSQKFGVESKELNPRERLEIIEKDKTLKIVKFLMSNKKGIDIISKSEIINK